ncbi:hypothetical protein GT354_52105, partial [Streptomyces sp. SID3343]|nr:hypothetical protein [Streptomyces sp. SID3343]
STLEAAEPLLRARPALAPLARALAAHPDYRGHAQLRLPARASGAWEALDGITGQLSPSDAVTWSAGLRRLRAVCEVLGERYTDATPVEVAVMVEAAEAEVRALCEWADTGARPDGELLVFSLRLPWRVRWGAGLRESARRAVTQLLEHHAHDGEAERRRRTRLTHAVLDPPYPLPVAVTRPRPRSHSHSQPGPHPLPHPLPPPRPRVRPAEDERLAPGDLPGPWGSVLVRPDASGAIWLGAGVPYVAPFAGHQRELLAEGGAPELPSPAEWLSRTTPVGVGVIEVVGRDAVNPDAALHEPLAADVADPAEGLDGLAVVVDTELRPWLRRAGGSEVSIPVYGSCALIGRTDPAGRLLAALADAHGWDLTGRYEPTPAKVSIGAPAGAATTATVLPRVAFPDGTVLAPRRWRIDPGGPGGAASPAERYLAWRRVVEALGVPNPAYVRTGPDTPELLIRTDSPLIVRSLFDRLPPGTPRLELVEPAASPEHWPLTDEAGAHYAAELAVDWACADYWTEPPHGTGRPT